MNMIYRIRNSFTYLTVIEAADEQEALLMFAKQYGIRRFSLDGNVLRAENTTYYAESCQEKTHDI